MFTPEDLRTLVAARPFVAFRLHLSDGNAVEVRSPEQVLILRRLAVIGLLDPGASDTFLDRYTVVWYLHVAQVEMLGSGQPPFGPTVGPAGSPSPAPA
jgi:hypothetical protein